MMTNQVMNPILCPILDLGNSFNDMLYVGRIGTKYCCYDLNDTKCNIKAFGLACFNTKEGFMNWTLQVELPAQLEEVSFDEAIAIAKSRPTTLNCLVLLDNPDAPEFFYFN